MLADYLAGIWKCINENREILSFWVALFRDFAVGADALLWVFPD